MFRRVLMMRFSVCLRKSKRVVVRVEVRANGNFADWMR